MSYPQSTFPVTTADFAAKMAAAGAALATVSPDLPVVRGTTYFSGSDTFRLSFHDSWGWGAAGRVATWAEAYGASVYVTLSSMGGTGAVVASFVIDGVNFEIRATIGTAEAYRLGAVMGRPLNPDKGLSLTPAEMRSALTLIGGA